MHLRLLMCGALGTALAIGAGMERAYAADDAIVIHSRGLDGLLVDDKDIALRDALHLLGDRLAELPGELREPDMPGALLQMAAQMLMSPMTLRMGVIEEPVADGPPIYLALSVEAPNQDTARGQAEAFLQILAQAMGGAEPQEAPGQPDLRMVDLDGVPLYIGAGQAGGKPAFIAAVNTDDVASPDFDGIDLPEGAEPVFVFQFDGEELQPLIEMAMQQAPPMERGFIEQQLAMSGLTGDHPIKLELAVGHGADLTHVMLRLDNYLANPNFSGMFVREPLTKAMLDMVPSDATYAQLGRTRLSALGDMFDAMIASIPEEERGGVEDPFAMIEEQIGIHPKRDLLDHLGDTFGAYMSDTTGGGGLLSTVVFISVSNEDALEQTFAKLRTVFNQQAVENANGYVQLQERTLAGHDMVTLSFPGIPIPLEISYALENGYLTVAATPQALIGALNHVRTRGRGLTQNERFAAIAGEKLAASNYVEFADTPRLIADGYGLTSLLMSALSNGLQSPGGGRDVGLLMPAYADLAKDVQPYILLGYIEGETIVYHGKSDRSALVSIAGTLGSMGGSSAIIAAAVGAGVLLPAIGQARASAMHTQGAAQLRNINMAAHVYSREHEGAMPDTAAALIEGGFITEDLLRASSGELFWLDFSAMDEFDARRIVGFDRGAYSVGEDVATLFGDGHVEILAAMRFAELTRQPPNDEVDFELPW